VRYAPGLLRLTSVKKLLSRQFLPTPKHLLLRICLGNMAAIGVKGNAIRQPYIQDLLHDLAGLAGIESDHEQQYPPGFIPKTLPFVEAQIEPPEDVKDRLKFGLFPRLAGLFENHIAVSRV
jgi:hypothetical protein